MIDLPEPVQSVLGIKTIERWSGTITLSLKDGRVIAYEVAEKYRVDMGGGIQPAPTSNR